MHYFEEIRDYLSKQKNGDELLEFLVKIYLPNENNGEGICRSYSCRGEDPPWLDRCYDILNKHYRYSRNLDWDISNDMPIDEDTANDVMEAGRNIYTTAEYLPYSLYQ